MTVKKAIELLDGWIYNKKQIIKQLEGEWHLKDDNPSEVGFNTT
jgi:hypothetical protein